MRFGQVKQFVSQRRFVIVFAVGMLLVGGVIYWRTRHHTPTEAGDSGVITVSTDKPSERLPEEEGYKWSGEPNDPKEITIDAIGVKGFIQKVGVDQNKRVGVPTNVHLAAWFVESARPGESGLSIIDGHIVDQSDLGIFTNLSELKAGDTYQIGFGDGSSKRFEVVETKVVAVDKAEAVLFSQDPSIRNQLNLITCGGTYDEGSRTFDKRVIVISELVQ